MKILRKRICLLVLAAVALTAFSSSPVSAASANCTNESFPSDVKVLDLRPTAFVGLDTNTNGLGLDNGWFYVCVQVLSVGESVGILVEGTKVLVQTCDINDVCVHTTEWIGVDIAGFTPIPTITFGPTIGCVVVCVQSVKLSFGTIGVYLNSTTAIPIDVCVAGPFMTCP